MRKRWFGVACVAAVACAARPAVGQTTADSTKVTREVRSLGLSIGNPGVLSYFNPRVPPFGDQGRCVTIPTEGGGRMLLLRFENGPGGAERNVSVEYDAAGTPLVYADVRGDLTGNGGTTTSITIRLTEGEAQAMNLGADAVPFYGGSAEEALGMENLGSPRVMIERVQRECGTGAK
jgi:hypothetical protein